MIIIHGENTVSSREKLVEIINLARNNKHEVIRLEAKKLTEAILEEILGASDLFETSKTIIIEELHSLPTSKKKKNLLDLLSQPQIHSIVLWEKRLLTKTMIKKISGSTKNINNTDEIPLKFNNSETSNNKIDNNKTNTSIFEFKISKTLFTWLDMLGNKENQAKKISLLHSAIKTDGEFFCFLMLVRQIKLLIEVKSGGIAKGAPFMVAKLNKQASKFTLNRLVKIYKKLLKLDIEQKTSSSLLSISTALDILSLKL